MYWLKRVILLLVLSMVCAGPLSSQREKVKNLPYVDMKWFHLGFHLGLHTQDLLLTNNGNPTGDGEIWFAEIPSYSPGFSVGVIGDLYLNPYFNLRFSPSIHFGDKTFRFREQASGEEFTTNVRSNYLNFPLDLKYTAVRLNNYRPYLIGGVYGAFDIVKEKTGEDPLEVFQKAMENVTPLLEVRTRRIGGTNYQVPSEVSARRKQTLALR